jgi:hypothetical protein
VCVVNGVVGFVVAAFNLIYPSLIGALSILAVIIPHLQGGLNKYEIAAPDRYGPDSGHRQGILPEPAGRQLRNYTKRNPARSLAVQI